MLALCRRAALSEVASPSWRAALQHIGLEYPTQHGLNQSIRGVAKQATEVRPGAVLELNGKLLQVVRSTHVNAGRQLGNISMELRDLASGAKHPAKFRPSESVEVVHLESRRYTCLYREGSLLHAMDAATYEQVAVEASLFDPGSAYLVEGMEVSMAFHDGRPIVGEVPATVTLEVREAAPTMRGETAAPSYKPAVLENGVRITVPPFVVAGDKVVVDTREGTFVKRA
ncbi:Elongation factor P [Auxenochlorella protothecoides]|uniref:Elongation factor P n=1 Tax=Auxenochlorella protothecoides TaxID=3075 RepID=A0A087SFZ4_AUXPR|nr:Elongation factor P [Auxenochlorella protothecoides]KFM24648.1 Elongation factor P [Auxenochlorella protothecoides]RMZ53146.1 hypothetical protein APUTEX25_005135 [Auxenochlorella protothecoides]|eukprot:RMZ53146.1 hypothetical protein APUTEX25_005135 [Auxenochlorella protothecoides]